MTAVEPQDALEEVEAEEPREGTLAWLQHQEHVDFHGLLIPSVHRIAEGSGLGDPEPAHCRVVKPTGERCKARPTRSYGICIGHLGGGVRDYALASKKAHASKAKLKLRRELLGIGPARAANPRQIARLRAHERAEELAEALVDGPLDDPELGSLARQAAALRALDATYPVQALVVELELPSDPDEVGSMSWESMRRMAATLMGEGEVEARTPPVPLLAEPVPMRPGE